MDRMTDTQAAHEIDAIIAGIHACRGATVANLRRTNLSTDTSNVKAGKWRKPSKPEGVATWVSEGNLCMADVLKSAVRLTFPQGARLDDPAKLFNTRLDSKSVRAIDVFEDVELDEDALRRLMQQAVAANREK